jgi:hypothetical protein
MNSLSLFKTSLMAVALLALTPVQAALTSNEMSQAKAQIDANYKTDKAACNAMKGNVKDVCQEEAKAKEKVAHAELAFRHSGSMEDSRKLATVKAETTYAVSKEKCDDWSGNAKDVCVKEAKAIEVKALADTKMAKAIGEARTDASDEKREANYKLAAERCDSMSGDAKSACMAAAKANK